MAIGKPDHEIHQRRKGTNKMLGLILGGFVLLVFAVTIVKLTGKENYRGQERVPGLTPNVVVVE